MRLLAASIIAVAMAFSGSDADGIPGDGDDDGIECAEYQSGGEGKSQGGLLNVASQICKTPIHYAWIATYHHQPNVAVAMNLDRPHTALIEISNETPPDSVSIAFPRILSLALNNAREKGALKAIISPEGVSLEDIRQLAEKQGWRFWRYQKPNNSIEMMVDLYHQVVPPSRLA